MKALFRKPRQALFTPIALLCCGLATGVRVQPASAQTSEAWAPVNSTAVPGFSNADSLQGTAADCNGDQFFVLRTDGKIACWGRDDANLDVPNDLPCGVASIAVGTTKVLARLSDGTLRAWGGSQALNPPLGLGLVQQAVIGHYHALAIGVDGFVRGWGDDSYGEVAGISGLSGFVQVSAGSLFSVGLRQNGTVACFGISGMTSVPADLGAVIAIDAGFRQALVVRSDGTVRGWGTNFWAPPSGLSGVSKVAAGYDHAVALRSDGSVIAWGDAAFGAGVTPVGIPPARAVAAALTSPRSMALTMDGEVVMWGVGDYGSAFATRGVPDVSQLRKVVAGDQHIVQIAKDGLVTSWGVNTWGQTSVPADLGPVKDVAIGRYHTLALTSGASVRSWGSNFDQQVSVPSGLGAVRAVAAGDRHSLALRSTGSVVGWGYNFYGQTVTPEGLESAVEIAAGADFSGARTVSGSVRCWGRNESNVCSPPASLGVVDAIAFGGTHAMARRPDGTVVGWGSVTVPATLGPVRSISAGGSRSAAIKQDGTLVVWGVVGAEPLDTTRFAQVSVSRFGFAARRCRTPREERWSGNLGAIGFGSPRTVTFNELPPAAGPVTLTVRARGDFSDANEYLTINFDGIPRPERIFELNATDCPLDPDSAVVTISQADFNARAADRTVVITLAAQFVVSATQCLGGYSEVGLSYHTLPFDCDGDGLEDACEIAADGALDCDDDGRLDACQPLSPSDDCDGNGQRDACQILAGAIDEDSDRRIDSCEYDRSDLNLDGIVGSEDLALLLNLWGSLPAEAGDFDHDGSVGGADLSILLARWGPVVWP